MNDILGKMKDIGGTIFRDMMTSYSSWEEIFDKMFKLNQTTNPFREHKELIRDVHELAYPDPEDEDSD